MATKYLVQGVDLATFLPGDSDFTDVLIEDGGTSATKVWSASKANTEFSTVNGQIVDLVSSVTALESGYQRFRKVINIVNRDVVPPTEVEGDRYILDDNSSTPHANWDGGNSWDVMEFLGGKWNVMLVDANDPVINEQDSAVDPETYDGGGGAGELELVDRARYKLTGTPHANWDGATEGDIVMWDLTGTTWEVLTPAIEGMICYVDDQDKDAVYIDDPSVTWEIRTAGAGATAWGDISGTLSAQTDLNTALGLKANAADLGGAALLDVGTGAGSVAAGDDARLSDARTPITHAMSAHTDEGDAATKNVGTGAGDVAAGTAPAAAVTAHKAADAHPTSEITGLVTALGLKAATVDVLAKTNTTSFTPTGDYQPATMKYVDDIAAATIEPDSYVVEGLSTSYDCVAVASFKENPCFLLTINPWSGDVSDIVGIYYTNGQWIFGPTTSPNFFALGSAPSPFSMVEYGDSLYVCNDFEIVRVNRDGTRTNLWQTTNTTDDFIADNGLFVHRGMLMCPRTINGSSSAHVNIYEVDSETGDMTFYFGTPSDVSTPGSPFYVTNATEWKGREVFTGYVDVTGESDGFVMRDQGGNVSYVPLDDPDPFYPGAFRHALDAVVVNGEIYFLINTRFATTPLLAVVKYNEETNETEQVCHGGDILKSDNLGTGDSVFFATDDAIYVGSSKEAKIRGLASSEETAWTINGVSQTANLFKIDMLSRKITPVDRIVNDVYADVISIFGRNAIAFCENIPASNEMGIISIGISKLLDNLPRTEGHLVTLAEVAAGFFNLACIPENFANVRVNVIGGSEQKNAAWGLSNPDFDVIGRTIHINGAGGATGLSEDIITGDELIISYEA